MVRPPELGAGRMAAGKLVETASSSTGGDDLDAALGGEAFKNVVVSGENHLNSVFMREGKEESGELLLVDLAVSVPVVRKVGA